MLLYQPQAGSGVSQLLWSDRNGKQIGSVGAPGNQANPRISPDGQKIAINISDPQTGNVDIWIYGSVGGIPSRLTSDPGFESGPVWSADGAKIIFARYHGLFEKRANGGGNEEVLLRSLRTQFANDWSKDGRYILFVAFDPTTNLELWTLPVDGDRKPIPFMKAPFGVIQGQFSPDGRWLAYSSNESGKWEVHVAPFPGPGGNWQVSNGGGSEPRWRRDGKELFYMAPDGKIMAVDVIADTTFEAGTAKPLFLTHRRETISSTDMFTYDVSPDGQRFLVNTDVTESNFSSLTLVLNWAAGLKH
jgi:eukaryotic-like serine/threonine-protein kinase